MNIAMINASPKSEHIESASGILLDELKNLLSSENIKNFHINKPRVTEDFINELHDCSTWIFAFPLYVDAVPSHLLSCMRQVEKSEMPHNADVYAIVNCGFIQGIQARNALSVMENWCFKCGFNWRTGIGFGGGGALESMKTIPLGKGPKTALGNAYKAFAESILTPSPSQSSMNNTYISINFPRFLYKFAAQTGWAKLIKSNGGKKKDLSKKL